MKIRILLSLVVLSIFVPAQEPGTLRRSDIREDVGKASVPLTAFDVAKIRVVVAAEISPDGKQVAILTSVPRLPSEPNGRAHSELSVIPFEGGETKILVPTPGTFSGPKWSGDSKSILFLSKRGDDKEARVWSVAAAGGDPKPLTPTGIAVKAFAATPDGKRLAFTEDELEDPARTGRKKAGYVHEVYEEEWRAVKVRELELESGKIRTYDVPGSAFELGYNANGTKLCVTAAPTPSVDDSYMRKDVYVADVATGAVIKAIDPPGKMGNAAVSPDGQLVAAVIGVDEHDPHESTLVVADATKPAPYKVLTPSDYQGHVAQCLWYGSADILALVHEGTESALGLFSAASAWSSQEPASNSIIKPRAREAGAITRMSTDVNEGIALVVSRPDHPAEAYAYTLKAGAPPPKRLTNSNPWIGEGSIAKQEVIKWKASLDGQEIQGILIHPLQKPTKPAPLIVSVHGGPEAHDMNGWLTAYSLPGQVAAGKGYYVLHPNYRSSTGRGVAYSKLGQGDLANGEFTDILDGVDWLIAQGLVDKAKVGITGGSYGGYLSAWAATKWTSRFAASVVFVGVTDQVSKRLCTDIPMEDYLVHWKIWTDENHALVWDRSPIAHAKGSKTPTLICHGKDDPRVHPSQSLELYRTLKTRSEVPVRLIWYPGEGHGNQLRASRLDYSLRMMAWFDHFLMKGAKDLPPAEMEYEESK
jgi:dipeptidyl aminopeptidase/acylaminoacyl peptidase